MDFNDLGESDSSCLLNNYFKNEIYRASVLQAQQVKSHAVKPDDLSLTPEAHMVEEEN